MPYDALGNYIQGDDAPTEAGTSDAFANAAQYLKDKASLGARVLSKSGTAAIDAMLGTSQQLMQPGSSSKETAASNARESAIIAETPLRVPTAVGEAADLPLRVSDAIQQPDYTIEEPRAGEYGPRIRKVGSLEAFAQAQYGTHSANDVAQQTRAYLLEKAQEDPSLIKDPQRMDQLRDGFMKSLMPVQRRALEDADNAISDFAGAPRDVDKTTGEKLLQTGIMSAIPNPSLPGKFGSFASEILAPGVNLKNYSGGAVALNEALGVGGQVLLDHWMQPVTADELKSTPPREVGPGQVVIEDKHDSNGQPLVAQTQYEDGRTNTDKAMEALQEHPSVNPVLAIPFFGSIAAAFAWRGLAHGGAAAIHGVDNAAIQRLNTLADKAPNIPAPKPELLKANGVAAAADETAPIAQQFKNAGVEGKSADDSISKATAFINSNVHEDITHWERTGELPNWSGSTMSKAEIRQFAQKLQDNGLYQAFNEGILAKTELKTRMKFVDDLTDKINDLDTFIQSARNRGSNVDVAKYTAEQDKLKQQKMDIITNVNPPGMSNKSWDELRSAVFDFDRNSMFTDFQNKVTQDNIKWTQYLHEQKLISDDTAMRLVNNAEDYIPRIKDPYDGAKGLARVGKKAQRWLGGAFDDATGDALQEKVYTHSESPYAPRRMDNGDARVEAPMAWDDALHVRAEHTIRHAQYQNFIRTTVDELRTKAGARAADVMDTLGYNGTLKSREQWAALMDKPAGNKMTLGEKIEKEKWIPVSRGNELEYVRFKDPAAHAAALMQPTSSNMFTRVMSRMNKPFRELTTGKFSMYQATSSLFDTGTIAGVRPMGSVYSIDYGLLKGLSLYNKLGSAFGLNHVAYDGKIAETLKHVGRGIENQPIMGGWAPAYVMNFGTAVQTFAKTYGRHIGAALTQDLANDSPLFATLAKTNPAFMQRLGQNLVDAHADSLFAQLTRSHVAHDPYLARQLKDMREIDSWFDSHMPRALRLTGQVLGAVPGEMFTAYKHSIAAIESAARVGYAMRNIEMEALKYGGDWRSVPKGKINEVIRDARTMAGDFGRRAGPGAMQKATTIIPYSNVMLKTGRAMQTRMFGHDVLGSQMKVMKPSTWKNLKFNGNAAKTTAYITGMALSGAVLPRIQSDLAMTNTNDTLRDYFYNTLTDWEREQYVFMPKPQTYLTYLSRNPEKLAALTPDDFYKWEGVPEFRPMASAVSSTLRMLGAYNDHGNVSNPQSWFTPMGIAAGQAFAPNIPPAIQAALQYAGAKVDLGKMFNLQSPIDAVTQGSTRSGAYDMMNVTSSMSRGLSDAIAALFGPGGARLAQAFDTGIQVYEQNGHHYLDAIAHAFDDATHGTLDNSKRVDTPGLSELDSLLQKNAGISLPFAGRATEKVYRRTPAAETVKHIRDITSQVSGRSNTFGKDGTGDMLLDDIIMDVRMGTRDPEYKELSDQWRETNDALQRNAANKVLKYEDRQAHAIELTRTLNTINVKQATMLQRMQEEFNQVWGKQYEVKFGKPFTWDDFATRVQTAKRKSIAAGPQ